MPVPWGIRTVAGVVQQELDQERTTSTVNQRAPTTVGAVVWVVVVNRVVVRMRSPVRPPPAAGQGIASLLFVRGDDASCMSSCVCLLSRKTRNRN